MTKPSLILDKMNLTWQTKQSP